MEFVVRLVRDPWEATPRETDLGKVAQDIAREMGMYTADGPGGAIEVGLDTFVDYSWEPVGLQVAFDDGIPLAYAKRLADALKAKFEEVLKEPAEVVWYSEE